VYLPNDRGYTLAAVVGRTKDYSSVLKRFRPESQHVELYETEAVKKPATYSVLLNPIVRR
jgi:hypothetical protein